MRHSPRFDRVFVLLLLLLVVGCAAGWSDPQDVQGKLSVRAPGTLESQSLGPNTTTHSTSDGRYSVLLTVPAERPADESLDIIKTITVRQTGGQETHSSSTRIAARPALRYGVKTMDNGQSVAVEALAVVLADGTVAQLLVNNGDHETFFKSLTF